MNVFLNAFTMVFFAEMGDKSQILAMSFAAKYPLRKVAAGIMIGIAINHGLAVALGFLLGKMLPVQLISIIAGLLFLFFGWQSFKLEEEDDDNQQATVGLSVVNTIALAFFLGEFGDKTQLTATALASTTSWPLIVFLGTYSAMLATSVLGIAAGSLLGSKLPEHLIKGVSGIVFIIFGTQKLYEQLDFMQTWWISLLYMVIVSGITFATIKPLYLDWRSGRLSPMQKAAEHLKQMKEELRHLAEGLCIGHSGTNGCDICRGSGCIVGQTKILIDAIEFAEHRENHITNKAENSVRAAIVALDYAVDKQFNLEMADAGLELLDRFKEENSETYEHYRYQLEPIEQRLKQMASCR